MRKPYPAAAQDDLSLRVSQQLTERLLEGWLPDLAMAIAFTALGHLILGGSRDPGLAVLYALGCFGLAVRMIILVAFPHRTRQAFGRRSLIGWNRAYAVASILFAAALGAFAARAFAVANPAVGALVTALVFACATGIVARLAIRPRIALASLALALFPPILVLVASGDVMLQAIGAVFSLFGLGSAETIRMIARSVTANVMLRHHLTEATQHDSLTGIANRELFVERLGQALVREPSRLIAIHHLDLDRFRPVNDAFGDAVGDALLKAVVGRLEGLAHPGDLVARLGGDAFAVMQADGARTGEVQLLARRMVRALSAPFDIAGHEIRIGTSVGIAVAPGDGRDPDTLIAAAAAALHRAKMGGRNGFAFANASEPALAS